MSIPLKTARLLAILAAMHGALPLAAARADDLGPSALDIASSDCHRLGGTVDGSKCRIPRKEAEPCGLGCLVLFTLGSWALAAYLNQPPQTATQVSR